MCDGEARAVDGSINTSSSMTNGEKDAAVANDSTFDQLATKSKEVATQTASKPEESDNEGTGLQQTTQELQQIQENDLHQTWQYDTLTSYQTTERTTIQDTHSPKVSKKRNFNQRCRRCGKCYALPEWRPYHPINKPSIEEFDPAKKPSVRHLRNIGEGNKVWDLCTVPESEFEKGFPYVGKTMPRLPTKRAREESANVANKNLINQKSTKDTLNNGTATAQKTSNTHPTNQIGDSSHSTKDNDTNDGNLRKAPSNTLLTKQVTQSKVDETANASINTKEVNQLKSPSVAQLNNLAVNPDMGGMSEAARADSISRGISTFDDDTNHGVSFHVSKAFFSILS
jgi:hypothetical protein